MGTNKNIKKQTHKIYSENLQDKITLDKYLVNLLKKAVIETLKISDIKNRCEVAILLVDDTRIREINSEFRKIDAATDVLSFPLVEMNEGIILSMEGDFNRDEDLLLLGDIVISLERAEKQAQEYGHPFARELAFLVTHGAFHLLGYDHQNSMQESSMFGKQEEVLSILGLARK